MLTVSIIISSRRESAYRRAVVPAIPKVLLAAHAAVHLRKKVEYHVRGGGVPYVRGEWSIVRGEWNTK